MARKILPLALLSALAAAAFLLAANKRSPSRESALPLLRTVKEHVQGADRTVGKLMPLDPEEERRIGAELAKRLRVGPAAPPEESVRRAQDASRIKEFGQSFASAPSVKRFRGRYEFSVLYDTRQINAFAIPGGFVFATEGLMRRFAPDGDAFGFVLAHEIGHVELGHCADNFRTSAWFRNLGLAPLGAVFELVRSVAALQFSEVQELEADQFALRLLHERRRNLQAALRAMDLVGVPADEDVRRDPGQIAVEGLGDFLRTHPGGWERRNRLREQIEKLDRRR